jgi:hypothetical protein
MPTPMASIKAGQSAFSYTSNVTTMTFDDFRVRNLVNPEPTTSLGSEQPKP